MNFTFSRNKNRVQTPTVLQMETSECGAASLAMVCAYYGLKLPLEQLRIDCGVSRDGSKASHILKAARKHGFIAKGYRKEPQMLKKMRLPMIIFWNFKHFVVLEGFKKDRVYLNDPASGKRQLTWQEFDEGFTGVVLTFEPSDQFEKKDHSESLLRALLSRFRNGGSALSYVVMAGLFLVIPGLVVPVFSRIFVDNILIDGMQGWLRPLLFGMALTAIVRGGLTGLQEQALLRFETKLAVTSTARFFSHILKLPIEFFAQRMPGEIVSRIQINNQVANLLSRQLASNLLNAMMVLFYAVVMFYYDALLTCIGITVAGVNLLALQWVSKRRTLLNQKVQQEMGQFMGVSMSGLQLIETLKATGGEQDFFAKWSGHEAKALNAQQELAGPSLFLGMASPFLMLINNTAILGLGAIQVMDGHMTMGMLIAFQSLMASFMGPFNQLVSLGASLQQVVADIRRLDDAMKYPQDRRFLVEPPPSPRKDFQGRLELRDLCFGYSPLAPPPH